MLTCCASVLRVDVLTAESSASSATMDEDMPAPKSTVSCAAVDDVAAASAAG
jgi:hypothetical protein